MHCSANVLVGFLLYPPNENPLPAVIVNFMQSLESQKVFHNGHCKGEGI